MEFYEDRNRTFEERAADLVSRMTLEEKIMQVGNNSAPIPRLGVPKYDYWSEASHGFFGPFESKQMNVTSYPVCLAMSQSWDEELIRRVTDAISDECRAHHNLNGIELHMWCPTVNMARDPRNGRSDENFGEDPLLSGKMSASYIRGMQGDDKKYIKVVATPKHYAMNSSENNRHTGSSNVDEATLREYYAKVFEYAVREGKAESIMTSYNRVNGVPSSVNDFLLTTLLREEWGFNGFVVSDCGAVADCYINRMFAAGSSLGHFYCKSLEEASAMSLIAGTDLSCGAEHKKALMNAVQQGLISEDSIDRALIRVLTSRFRLGLFDDADCVPYNRLGTECAASRAQADLSVEMANDTIVLLKNEKNLLPLKKTMKSVLVIGPNAIYRQLGGYSAGQTPLVDTVVNVMALDGIRNELKGTDVKVEYQKGWCTANEFGKGGIMDSLPGFNPEDLMLDVNMDNIIGAYKNGKTEKRHVPDDPDFRGDDEILFARALDAAKNADVVIVVAGTDDATASEEHDRDTLELPYNQNEKILKLLDANPNTVVVLTTLGAVTGDFIDKAHTLLNAHFAGQEQGTAIANILFGKVNPNAKLTATWYKHLSDLPHINEYGIKKQDTQEKKARTYMYFDGPVNFPFGYGLSYTAFDYGSFNPDKRTYDANETLTLSVDVTNSGNVDGAEIVQVYLTKLLHGREQDNKPFRQLKAFRKIWLKAGETKTVIFRIPIKEMAFWSNLHKKMIVENGDYLICAGRSSADLPCSAKFSVTGRWNASISGVYAIADKYCYHIGERGQILPSATLEDTTHLNLCTYKPVYASSDPSVASVDDCGVITAKSAGTASITVSVNYDGRTKSASLPVAVH